MYTPGKYRTSYFCHTYNTFTGITHRRHDQHAYCEVADYRLPSCCSIALVGHCLYINAWKMANNRTLYWLCPRHSWRLNICGRVFVMIKSVLNPWEVDGVDKSSISFRTTYANFQGSASLSFLPTVSVVNGRHLCIHVMLNCFLPPLEYCLLKGYDCSCCVTDTTFILFILYWAILALIMLHNGVNVINFQFYCPITGSQTDPLAQPYSYPSPHASTVILPFITWSTTLKICPQVMFSASIMNPYRIWDKLLGIW